jgi:branched-chain amino acid transport system permease protein
MGAARVRAIAWGAAAAAVLAIAAVPFLVDDRYLLKVLTFIALDVIVVAGLALLFGYAGQISLGQGAFVGLGAYAAGYAATALHWPFWADVCLGMTVAALGGLVLALPSLRLKGHYLAMATLGFNVIMSIMFVEAKGITGGNDGLSQIPNAAFGGLAIDTPASNYLLAWGVAAIVLLLASGIVARRPGRAMTALHGSEIGAQACGVDPMRVKVSVFTLSAALAGLSGALYAHFVGYISPSSFSLEKSIILLAIVVLGGSRSLIGPVVACIGLTILPFLDAIVPGLSENAVKFLQDWEADIYGIAIIVVMLFAPGGLAAGFRALAKRLGRGPTAAAEAGDSS